MTLDAAWIFVTAVGLVAAAVAWHTHAITRRPSEAEGRIVVGFDGSRSDELVVTLTVDTSRFDAAMRRAQAATVDMSRQFAKVSEAMRFSRADIKPILDRINAEMNAFAAAAVPWWCDPKRREVKLAGEQAKLYVRFAMDPDYTTPIVRDHIASEIIAGRGEPWYAILTPEERAELAGAALAGWHRHRKDESVILAVHRLYGDTRVEVTRT